MLSAMEKENCSSSPPSRLNGRGLVCDTQVTKVEFFTQDPMPVGAIVHEIKIEIETGLPELPDGEEAPVAVPDVASPDNLPVFAQNSPFSTLPGAMPSEPALSERKSSSEQLEDMLKSLGEEREAIKQSNGGVPVEARPLEKWSNVSDGLNAVASATQTWRDMRDHCMEGGRPRDLPLDGSFSGGLFSPTSPEASIYQIKWITFQGAQCPIVTQNKNGPCPLISVINVLLLTRRMRLESGIEYQSGENLLCQLAGMILESVPQKASESVVRNYEQNIQDALAILPKLQTGIDINVKFAGPREYEFTQETLLFDLLNVPLVHGWIADMSDAVKGILEKHASYNGIVEFVINGKTSDDQEMAREALIAEDWLERTQSQMTYAGLVALCDCLNSHVPCVLFRNNHFSTIVKHENQIFLLVTDQGYASEMSCVWERMNNIEGDTDFFDDAFCVRVSAKPPAVTPLVKASSPANMTLLDLEHQMEFDRQLALSLAQEQDMMEFRHQETKDVQIIVHRDLTHSEMRTEEQRQDVVTASEARSLPTYPPAYANRPTVLSSHSAYQLTNVHQDLTPGQSDQSMPAFDRRFDSEHNLTQRHTSPAAGVLAPSVPVSRRLPQSATAAERPEKKDKCQIS